MSMTRWEAGNILAGIHDEILEHEHDLEKGGFAWLAIRLRHVRATIGRAFNEWGAEDTFQLPSLCLCWECLADSDEPELRQLLSDCIEGLEGTWGEDFWSSPLGKKLSASPLIHNRLVAKGAAHGKEKAAQADPAQSPG
jgi:hypothetical protein